MHNYKKDHFVKGLLTGSVQAFFISISLQAQIKQNLHYYFQMLGVFPLYRILWHFRKNGFCQLTWALRSKGHMKKWYFFGAEHTSKTEQKHMGIYEIIAA